MEEKELSGEEKRKALKEEFKKDLRERQVFLEKMKALSRQQKILKAVEGLKVEDDSDEWIQKINEETAFIEAKMEIAMESADEKQKESVSEEELQKAVAEEMVKQLKKEMQGAKTQEENTSTTLSNLEEEGKDTSTTLSNLEEEKKEGPVRKMLDEIE